MKPSLGILVLAGACQFGEPFTVPTVPFVLDAPTVQQFDSLWAVVNACSGTTPRAGSWQRINWYLVTNTDATMPSGKRAAGEWWPAAMVYLWHGYSDVRDARLWPDLVKHEMLHFLLQDPHHGTAFMACGLIEFDTA